MAIDASNIWQLTNALDSKPEDKTNTRLATVSRIDNEGHVWVSIPGGETETPTETTDVEVERGDTVTVEWRNNKLYVMGNSTQPATSTKRVAKIVEPIEETANEAAAGVGKAVAASKAAQQAAAEAAAAANATSQHFWHNEAGAHVTDDTKDAFVVAERAGFPDWQPDIEEPDYKPWYNVLLNSLGQVFRTANKYLASFTHSALTFFDGEWNGEGDGADHIVAMFGKDGAQIGANGITHVNIDNDSLDVTHGSGTKVFSAGAISGEPLTKVIQVDANGVTAWQNDGYKDFQMDAAPITSVVSIPCEGAYPPVVGEFYDYSIVGSDSQYIRIPWKAFLAGKTWTITFNYYASDALYPYITMGDRLNGAAVAAYSASFGSENIADSEYSFAAGKNAYASGKASAAFGQSGSRGDYSFSAGFASLAYEEGSAAFGIGTNAYQRGQLTCGTFSTWDTGYLFSVGNGTELQQSNALDVDLSGNTTIAGGLYLRDSNGDITGVYRRYSGTNYNGTEQYSTMNINGSNVYNTLNLRVHSDGSRSVYVTDSAPWRTALDVDQKSYISDAGSGRAIQVQYSGTAQDPTDWYCMWQNYKIVAVPAKLEITNASEIGTVASGTSIIDFKYVQSGKTAQLYIGFSFNSAKAARDVVITLKTAYRPATYAYSSSFTNFLPCEIHTDGRIRISAAAAANRNYYVSFTYILA